MPFARPHISSRSNTGSLAASRTDLRRDRFCAGGLSGPGFLVASLCLILAFSKIGFSQNGQATFRTPQIPDQQTLGDIGKTPKSKPRPKNGFKSSTQLRSLTQEEPSSTRLLDYPFELNGLKSTQVSTQEPVTGSGESTVTSPANLGVPQNSSPLPSLRSSFRGFTPSQPRTDDPNWRTEQEAARSGLQEYVNRTDESNSGETYSLQIDQDIEVMEELPPELQPRIEDLPASNGTTETIIQRFPNGKKRIVREVAQDENGNFANHGRWEVFDPNGKSIAAGIFNRGVMQGQWRREHTKSEGGLFTTKPFNLYQGPFLSVANFKDGKLDGLWTIYDQFRSKIFEITYKDGVRDGTATWWYPDRAKMREANFKDGLIHGYILGWDEAEKPTRREEYVEGRRIVRTRTFYRPQKPKLEEHFLDTKLEPEGQDDWWQAKPTGYLERGSKVKNGGMAEWYENGQLKRQGQFKEDQPIGRFIWWHANGNKQIQGLYVDGQKNRVWTWWYSNGMKKTEGKYKNDQPVGLWRAWYEDGTLRKEEDFSAAITNEADDGGTTGQTNEGNSMELDGSQSVIEPNADLEELPAPLPSDETNSGTGNSTFDPFDVGSDKTGTQPPKTDPSFKDPFKESSSDESEDAGSLPSELFEEDNDKSTAKSASTITKPTLKWKWPSNLNR